MTQAVAQPTLEDCPPIPRYLPDRFRAYNLDGLSKEAQAVLGQIFDMGKRQPRALTHNQLSWLGSVHPVALGDFADEIHDWMCASPRDLRQLIGIAFDENLY